MNHRKDTPATASLISQALLAYRRENKVTYEEMVKQLGISKPTIVAHIYGDHDCTVRMMKKFARLFGWTPEEVGVAALFKPKSAFKKKKGRKK